MSDYIPASPQSMAIRPLSKGMKRDTPAQMLEAGAGWTVRGLFVTANGLERRDGWHPLLPGSLQYGQVPIETGELVTDFIPFFKADGSFQLLALTTLRLYVLGDLATRAWSPVPFSHASYAITGGAASTYVCAAADFVTDKVRIGDRVRVLIGATYQEANITNVAATTLTVDVKPVGSPTALIISHLFFPGKPDVVDFTSSPGYVLLCDGTNHGIMKWDGSLMSDFEPHGASGDTPAAYLYGARTITYLNGVVYIGNTVEHDGVWKQRIRWSSLTDNTEFAMQDYVSFDKEASPVMKLISLEDTPLVYLESAIYAGQPSSLTGLPFDFIKAETGGMSAAGMRAMTSMPNGQAFVSQGNIYYFAPNRVGSGQPLLEAIGTPVLPESVRKSKQIQVSRALYVPSLNALAVTFCENTLRKITKVFYFWLDTKAWSYVDEPLDAFTCLSLVPAFSSTSWGTASGTWGSTLYTTSTWASFNAQAGDLRLVSADSQGFPYAALPEYADDQMVSTGTYLPTTTPITVEYESGDLDLNMPDQDKVFTRLSASISQVLDQARSGILTFFVEMSTTKGRTWESAIPIAIEADTDEDDTSFRKRAAIWRFRIYGQSLEPKWRFDEFIVRARQGGLQVQR